MQAAFPKPVTRNQGTANQIVHYLGRDLYNELRVYVGGWLHKHIPAVENNNQVRGFFIAYAMYHWIKGYATRRAAEASDRGDRVMANKWTSSAHIKNEYGLLVKGGLPDLLRGVHSLLHVIKG